MIGLTTQQRDLLAFIESYHADHPGISPSFREMMDGVGLKSTSGVYSLINQLEERGRIRRIPRRVRAIEVIAPDALFAFSTGELLAEIDRRRTGNLAVAA